MTSGDLIYAYGAWRPDAHAVTTSMNAGTDYQTYVYDCWCPATAGPPAAIYTYGSHGGCLVAAGTFPEGKPLSTGAAEPDSMEETNEYITGKGRFMANMLKRYRIVLVWLACGTFALLNGRAGQVEACSSVLELASPVRFEKLLGEGAFPLTVVTAPGKVEFVYTLPFVSNGRLYEVYTDPVLTMRLLSDVEPVVIDNPLTRTEENLTVLRSTYVRDYRDIFMSSRRVFDMIDQFLATEVGARFRGKHLAVSFGVRLYALNCANGEFVLKGLVKSPEAILAINGSSLVWCGVMVKANGEKTSSQESTFKDPITLWKQAENGARAAENTSLN